MSQYFPSADEQGHHTIFPGVHIHTFALERLMVSVVDLEPGAVVEEHAHPHEQMGMWLAGQGIFTIGGEERIVEPGDVYRIPSNVRHKLVVLDAPARALDVFTPVREEYR